MISIDEAQVLLQQVADELPDAFWEALNGGVSLLPDTVRASYALADDLYTLGEYRIEPLLGRYINIYYGSIRRTYGNLSRRALKQELRRILFHEFTHHVESLAGERGLEVKDAVQMHEYLSAHASDAQDDGGYDIRPAVADDLPAIHALYETLFAEMAARQPTLYRGTRQDDVFLRTMLESDEAALLVAADARDVFGLALVVTQDTPAYTCLIPHHYGLLIDLIVSPDERGQGVGGELIKAAKDWARKGGLDYLELNVQASNAPARAFYAREGFSETSLTLQTPL